MKVAKFCDVCLEDDKRNMVEIIGRVTLRKSIILRICM